MKWQESNHYMKQRLSNWIVSPICRSNENEVEKLSQCYYLLFFAFATKNSITLEDEDKYFVN